MALGYAPTVRDVIAYYGGERREIADALARAARGRAVEFMDWPTVMRWHQSGEASPELLVDCVRGHLQQTMGSCLPDDVPPRYSGVHGTLEGDIVLEIDDRSSQRAAFEAGKRIQEFLESYEAPYRIKFSGTCSPHFILSRDDYLPLVPEERRPVIFSQLSAWFFSQLEERTGGKLDGAVCGSTGFLRLPYSLHERTGLVSVPIRPERYDQFCPEMAEMGKVQMEEWWFERAPHELPLAWQSRSAGEAVTHSAEARVSGSKNGSLFPPASLTCGWSTRL